MALSIGGFIRAIESFRILDPEIPSQEIIVFLTIAQNEGANLKEIGDKLGISQASMTRNVQALAVNRRGQKQGLDLVDTIENRADRRYRIVTLTSKGRNFMVTLTRLLNE